MLDTEDKDDTRAPADQTSDVPPTNSPPAADAKAVAMELLKLQRAERTQSRKKYVRVGGACVVIAGIVVGSYIAYATISRPHRVKTAPIGNSQNSAAFPVYMPTALPDGIAIDPSSYSRQPDVATYIIVYEGTKKMFVSQQAVPSQSVIDSLGGNKIDELEKIPLAIGEGFVAVPRGVPTASIATDKTWILITAPEGIDRKIMADVIRAYDKAVVQ